MLSRYGYSVPRVNTLGTEYPFHLTTVTITEPIVLYLPIQLFKILSVLHTHINTEFLVEMPVEEENNSLKVLPQVFVPDMSVSYASVETETSLGYKVFALHTHPSNMLSFSEIDEESINAKSFLSGLTTQALLTEKRFLLTDLRYRSQRPEYYSVIFYEAPLELIDVGDITYNGKLLPHFLTEEFFTILFNDPYNPLIEELANKLFPRNYPYYLFERREETIKKRRRKKRRRKKTKRNKKRQEQNNNNKKKGGNK